MHFLAVPPPPSIQKFKQTGAQTLYNFIPKIQHAAACVTFVLLIERIEPSHGESNYYLTEALTGHGCFEVIMP